MRIDIYHQADSVVLATLFKLIRKVDTMKQELSDAIAGLNAEVTDSNGKLASIRAFIEGVPALAAAAVADALAANDVSEADAAASIEAARSAFSDNVDSAMAAIDANPAPDEAPAPDSGSASVSSAVSSADSAPSDASSSDSVSSALSSDQSASTSSSLSADEPAPDGS